MIIQYPGVPIHSCLPTSPILPQSDKGDKIENNEHSISGILVYGCRGVVRRAAISKTVSPHMGTEQFQ